MMAAAGGPTRDRAVHAPEASAEAIRRSVAAAATGAGAGPGSGSCGRRRRRDAPRGAARRAAIRTQALSRHSRASGLPVGGLQRRGARSRAGGQQGTCLVTELQSVHQAGERLQLAAQVL